MNDPLDLSLPGETPQRTEPRSIKRIAAILALVLAALIAVGLSATFLWYQRQLQPLAAEDTSPIIVSVANGSGVLEIAQDLEERSLIRNATSFSLYVRFQADGEPLQAGSYLLSSSQSVSDIVRKLQSGDTSVRKVTILPASNLFDIEAKLVDVGYPLAAVEAALDAGQYPQHPALAHKPVGASLEGYLYPDTYFASLDQPPAAAVRLALDELADVITPELEEALSQQGLSVHQAIILASIIEQEVSSAGDRRQVAQVYLERINRDMRLDADPTFRYAAELLGVEPSVMIDSPYNTRRYPGLPPGPIGAVSASSLQALANPKSGDFLFFVSGDDGITYFAETLAEHERNVDLHCDVNCQL